MDKIRPRNTSVNPDELARQLGELVRVPSVTPSHAGPRSRGSGEARFSAMMADRCRSLGARVHVQTVMPDRPNVIAVWRGRSDRWLGIDAHADTVGVEQMQGDPFDGRIEDGRVFGRGAVDTKATIAICLTLLEKLHSGGQTPRDNLLLAITCDEEGGARGAPALAGWLGEQGIQLDELLVAEPTGCAPVHGHKGVLRQTFEIEGLAAHSSNPSLGRNAVLAGARLALAFDAEHRRLQANDAPSPLGLPSLTVSTLHGGLGASVVPDRATLTIDRRIVTGESAGALDADYRELARRASDLPFNAETTHAIDPFYQPPDAALVRRFCEWTGTKPITAAYCTNAWAYAGCARECIVSGPGSIEQAHGAVEWVAIDELDRMARAIAAWWGIGE